jgi:hypothetical protein
MSVFGYEAKFCEPLAMSVMACKQTFASQALSSLVDQVRKFGDGFQMSASHPTTEVN